MKTKTLRKSIYVTPDLKGMIVDLAKMTRKKQVQIIREAVYFYYTQLRQPKIKNYIAKDEKLVWYVTKLAVAVGALKAAPTAENLEAVETAAAQVVERLRVNSNLISALVETAKRYSSASEKERQKMLGELYQVAKCVVAEILSK